ncbi:Coiled-coil domain-containing protein [Helicobacter sp. L8]|uniref:Coiled-coil domain-containing protein n=1 Tax=Helicobacter sp. L8 TaxID=2316078 RepID=UPI000EB08C18|nr:Coiled-coil domain-containing protein [Helicobacter sp. L8]
MDAQPSLEQQENQLKVLKDEIAQAEASLEGDFAKWASENIDAQLEGLFFDDKEAFIKKLLEMQNQFLKDNLGSKVQQANDLQGQIHTKKGEQEVQQAQADFLAKHPDANMEEMVAFYQDDLPPKYKKELDNLQGVEFFETLYQLFKSYKGEEENLPQRLEGQAAPANNPNPQELVMDRF